jgi:RHS repeat-associated protein
VGNYTFAYTPDNRLASWTTNYNPITTEISQYDANGRLEYRGDGMSYPVYFGYDGNQNITTKLYSGGWAQSEQMASASATLSISYSDSAAPVQMYVLSDPLGNAAMATDSNGNVTDNCKADLYGTNCAPASAERNWLMQWGYQYRSGPHIYQVGARVYDPILGRFMQQDPMSEGEGDYTYAANSPANAVDPTGNTVIIDVLPIAGEVAAADGPLPFGKILAGAIIVGAIGLTVWDYYDTAGRGQVPTPKQRHEQHRQPPNRPDPPPNPRPNDPQLPNQPHYPPGQGPYEPSPWDWFIPIWREFVKNNQY